MLNTLIKIDRIQVPSRSHSSSKFVMKWLVVAEKIDRCRQSNSWILVSRTIAEGKMSEINYRTLKLTPSFISRKTKLPRSTAPWGFQCSSSQVEPRSTLWCRSPESLRAVSNLRHQTSDKSSECTSILQSARRRHARLLWLLSIFNKIETRQRQSWQ